MDIHVTLTLKLDPAFQGLLEGLISGRPAPAAVPAAPAAEDKKPRKSKADAAAPAASEPSPAPAQAALDLAREKEKGTALTVQDLTALVTETLDKCGTPTLRGIFAKFKVAKISDLSKDRYAEFAAELNEARNMVS